LNPCGDNAGPTWQRKQRKQRKHRECRRNDVPIGRGMNVRRRAADGAVRSSGNSPPRSVLVATGVRPNFPSWAGDVQSFDKIGTRCERPKGLKVGVTNAMNAGGTSLNFEMFDRDAEATHHARKRMRYWARRRAGKLCHLTLRHERLPNHIQAGNRSSNIGRPLFDSASVASS
jgi:hypothetical protein